MNTPVAAAPTFAKQNSEIVELLQPYAKIEGLNHTPVDSVLIYRVDHASPRMQVMYDPCLVIVAQGWKRGYFRDWVFDYNPSSYLACTLPLPFECEILAASPEEPFLALGFPIVPSEVSAIQMQIDPDVEPETGFPQPVDASPLKGEMLEAVIRLIRSFRDPAEAKVVGDLARREILYRVLMGAQGPALRAVVQRQGHFRRIGDVMRMINEDFARPISTSDMMEIAGMSKTVLHESFKAVTAMTPIQFVKSTRLHKAKALIIDEGVSASAAAFSVGYSSASQFSREYKRFFGHSPSETSAFG